MNISDINKENHVRATMWIKNADSRASIILAFNAALVALIVTENPYTHRFSLVFKGKEEVFLQGALYVGIIFFILFIACFIVSSVSAFYVVMMDVKKTHCEYNKVFSFMNITDLERSEYRNKLHNLSHGEILHAWEAQTYLVSELANRKMKLIAIAWKSLAGSIFFAITFIILTIFFI